LDYSLVSQKPRLYDCVVEALRSRHYSRRTEEAYLHWIRRFLAFHGGTHPRELAEKDLNRAGLAKRVATHAFRHSFATTVAAPRQLAGCVVLKATQETILMHEAEEKARRAKKKAVGLKQEGKFGIWQNRL
jgi:hypothetical protein